MASGFKAYPFDEIEPKWQDHWLKQKTFRAADPGEPGSEKPKYYVLDMFPYPSAAGLHVGHLEGYTATDIIARYKRMRGFNVLHPMGWDAFGLPAEQHALETGTHPRTATEKNVANFKRQIQRLGFSYDWEREVNTTDPDYFRWTQWIFMKLYEKGLAYEANMPVNWCPALGTVLANEEVIDGKSERGNHPVIRKPMRQWVLKITAFAERLLQEIESVDWPEPIKEMQRNWIGKSTGAEVDFELDQLLSSPNASVGDPKTGSPPKACGNDNIIRVFTTRPDTLFGATYMVLSPEHSLVSKITTPQQKKAVDEYAEKSARKSDLERTDLAKEKTGVFTGAYAINPVNQQKIPIWIADYVLISYGTGAIMSVPAHDERDFEFAKKFGLPIVPVIQVPRHSERSEESSARSFGFRPQDDGQASSASPPRNDKDPKRGQTPMTPPSVIASEAKQSQAFTGIGTCFNSTTPDKSFSIDGMPSDKAKEKITAWLEQKGIGKKSIQYKLRDWIFSRQRYWGEPIPIIHCEKCGIVPVPESNLPLVLPEISDFKPTAEGEPPLARASKEWSCPKCPKCGGTQTTRETNTMPQWAGSCWYYLRYLDPKNPKAAVDSKKEKYWMPVDLYVGGAEHAVLHLLYSRFWHKVLFDYKTVSTPEPFHKLVNQGMILGEDNQKMSKSRGNVVNPDVMVDQYGADSIRLYEMFMGPLEMTKPWSMQGVEGVYRFLGRVWRLFIDQNNALHSNIKNQTPTAAELKRLHQAIKKVTEDIEGIRLNTAISALMIFVNETLKDETHSREILEKFILLLAPFAPHMAEELWSCLGHSQDLVHEAWPVHNPQYLVEEKTEMAILIAGKVRGKIVVPKTLSEAEVREMAMAEPNVQEWLEGKKIKQVIVVPGRVVNIVV